MYYFGFIMLLKQWAKEKKEDDTFLWEKIEEEQNSVTIIISVDGKWTVVPMKLKLEEDSFE